VGKDAIADEPNDAAEQDPDGDGDGWRSLDEAGLVRAAL
jgi:hypothetical protein